MFGNRGRTPKMISEVQSIDPAARDRVGRRRWSRGPRPGVVLSVRVERQLSRHIRSTLSRGETMAEFLRHAIIAELGRREHKDRSKGAIDLKA